MFAEQSPLVRSLRGSASEKIRVGASSLSWLKRNNSPAWRTPKEEKMFSRTAVLISSVPVMCTFYRGQGRWATF